MQGKKLSGLISVASLFIFLMALSASPLSGSEGAIGLVNKLYLEINKAIKTEPIKEIRVYTNSNENGPQDLWYRDSGRATDKGFEESYFKAKVWLSQKNEIIKAVIVKSSPGGDWENTREYYFYGNGKTAFIVESHFTHVGSKASLPKGPYIIEKRIYYDPFGKEVLRLKNAFAASDKNKQINSDSLQQIDADYHRDTDALPFIKALK